MATKLERKTVDEFNKAVHDLFADLVNSQLRGIIYDRGSEMSGYRDLEQVLNCGIFLRSRFAMAAWDR
ncbi:MAG: hypothetical protein NZL89_02145 [Leptospiraceae bacterium]|nr:hypothetical protein [Leptospiraceae bacterium]